MREFSIMNRKLIATVFAAASLVGGSAFAAAQPYVSVAVGGSNANIDCSGTDSCSNNATAVKAIGGYDFGNSFAVEAMYVSLGSPKASLGGISTDIKSGYWGLGGAWRPAFNADWSGVARLGVAFASSKAEVTNGVTSGSQTFTSTQAYVGVGVAYAVTKDLKIEADLDSTQIQIGSGTDKASARVVDYTLGLTYGF